MTVLWYCPTCDAPVQFSVDETADQDEQREQIKQALGTHLATHNGARTLRDA